MAVELVFEAISNVQGYSPMADEPIYFRSAREAWDWHASERERAEDSAYNDGGSQEYSETHAALAKLADEANWPDERFTLTEPAVNTDGTGTLYGDTPGYGGDHDLGVAYCVVIVKHADYPHEPGRLYDCPLCEQMCFCGLETDGEVRKGETECIYCANVSNQ
jgi:hypothetical protein